jgi:hypothetical protein
MNKQLIIYTLSIICGAFYLAQVIPQLLPTSPAKINQLLFNAVRANNILFAKEALELGADVNTVEQGATTTHAAISGWTPLHWAASRGNERMVDLLLSYGAYSQQDANGRTPEAVARENGYPALAAKLGNIYGTVWGLSQTSSSWLPLK